MNPTSAKSRLCLGLLACATLVLRMLPSAFGEMPAGLEQALASYYWVFTFKISGEVPMHFQPDGKVIDSAGHLKGTWSLDKTSGTVHMAGAGKKPEQFDLWFYQDLTGFDWYENRYQNSGAGTRGDRVLTRAAGAAPAAPAVAVEPKKAQPSEQIEPLLEPCLDAILAPLEKDPQMPRVAVEKLRASLGAGAVKAKTPSQKQIHQYGMTVCEALTNGMDARAQAKAAAIASAQAPSLSNGSSIEKTSPLRGRDAGANTEAIRRKQQDERNYADKQGKGASGFIGSYAYKAWVGKAATLRENVMSLYAKLVQLEAAEPPAATAPAVSTPAGASEASSQGKDPALGPWLLEGRSLIRLEADHSIAGDRHGVWRCTGVTDGRREYELHWKPPKNWADHVVLSDDRKMLEGKTRNSEHISYVRPE